MANNSLSSIRSAIGTKLGELVTATVLKQVVSGRSSTPTGFPFCRYYLVGVDNELKDNTPSNWRSYRFAIDIVQEMTNKTVTDAEADFQDAIDAVLDKLNTEWTLTSNVDVSIVDGGTIAIVDGTQGPMLQATITLSAKTLIS